MKKQIKMSSYLPGVLTPEMRRFFHDWCEENLDRLQKRDKEYDKVKPVMEVLAKNNWVFSYFSVSDIEQLIDKDDSEILEYARNYFTADNYSNFFDIFASVKSYFEKLPEDKGYLELLIMIEDLLKQDFKYYKVLISTIMSIIEYKFIQKTGRLNTGKIAKCSNIKNSADRIVKSENTNLESILNKSDFKVLIHFYEGGEFGKGINGSKFGRHSIQHGRYNPERLEETDMIKSVLLLLAICESDEINSNNFES